MSRAERVAAAVAWLRRHPAVVSGPSVRAAVAFHEVAEAWGKLGNDPGLLPAALVALPHRLSVVPGADADELVRRAVAAVEDPPPDGPDDDERQDEDDGKPAGTGPRKSSPVETAHAARTPKLAAGDDDDPRVGPSEREAVVLLAALLPVWSRPMTDNGASPTLPTAWRGGGEVQSDRPFRWGDRTTDLSLRRTIRAAARQGSLDRLEPRAVVRRPTVSHAVVFALDASGSMFDQGRLDAARVACTGLAETLIRRGHSVGLVAFSDAAVVVCPLTRDLHTLVHRQAHYQPSDSTNVESALLAATDVLKRGAKTTETRHVVLLTDAEPTTHAGGTQGRRARGGSSGLALFGVSAARHQALLAAAGCKQQGIPVSVVCPDRGCDLDFAVALAEAGGGRARCLQTVTAPA